MDQIAKFKEGPPTRPPITHDHGFLDDGKHGYDPTKRQPPTAADQEKWRNANAFFVMAAWQREDLFDGLKAYRHFLHGKGADFTCDYEAFLKNDKNGQVVLASAIEDISAGVLDVFDKKHPTVPTADRVDEFSVTSDALGVGPDFRYPMPQSENWQKAIGAHALWISAKVKVRSLPATSIREVDIAMTLHAEDMYNFNPGASDIKTGIMDEENGRLEIVGLAQEFLVTGTAVRTLKVTVPLTKQKDNRNAPLSLTIK